MMPEDTLCQVKMGNICFFFSTWLQVAMGFPKSSTDLQTKFSNRLDCTIDFPLIPKLSLEYTFHQLFSGVETVC